MNALPTGYVELVGEIRRLYSGTKHEHRWVVVVRQSAASTGPLWEIVLGNRQLCSDTPEALLSLAKLSLAMEPL